MSDYRETLEDLLGYYALMPEKYREAIREALAENASLMQNYQSLGEDYREKEAEVERLKARVFELRGADLAYGFERKWALGLKAEVERLKESQSRAVERGDEAWRRIDAALAEIAAQRACASYGGIGRIERLLTGGRE